MPTTTSRHAVSSISDLLRIQAPSCECRHGDREEPCGERASVRVTVVCMAAGCDCAAGVYLVCARCLRDWRRSARRRGVTLRVAPLEGLG